MIRDLFLPRTDAGAFLQLVVVLVAFPPLVWWGYRRRRELGTLLLGVFIFILGYFALRAVH